MLESVFYAATTATASGGFDGSQYIAPGGFGAVLLGFASWGLKEWRAGRAINLERAEKLQTEAEKDRDSAQEKQKEIQAERDGAIKELNRKIDELNRKVDELHSQADRDRELHMTQLRDRDERHAREIAEARKEFLLQLQVNFRLEKELAAHNIPLPIDLDPAHPEVRPQLNIVDPVDQRHYRDLDDETEGPY